MIRISKLTDYGFVVLSNFILRNDVSCLNARDISEETNLPLPTVSKLLKILSKNGILSAQRGAKGGYAMQRSANNISVAEIIEIFEGPIALTECCVHSDSDSCLIECTCPTKHQWQHISQVIRTALVAVKLSELTMCEKFFQTPNTQCQQSFRCNIEGATASCKCSKDLLESDKGLTGL